MLHDLLRFWRTLRQLKSIQVVYRIKHKLFKFAVSRVDLPDANVCAALSARPASRISSMYAPFSFHFLGQRGELSKVGWDGPKRSKLWRYNQHYFDDLNATLTSARSEWHYGLIDCWIDDNLPFDGNGWEPYPTSLRIINWIKWSASGNLLSEKALKSLGLQTRFLAKNLEWHLLGNHLFSNAKALVYAGLHFQGAEADSWLNTGMHILSRQINEQVLEDGGHFELSPMYHALATEDVLDLINICLANKQRLSPEQVQIVQVLEKKLDKMLYWLAAMSHPDGKISFFNDAAFDIAPDNREIFAFARRLGYEPQIPKFGITDLKQSGFVRLENETAVMLFDAAEIGPTYLPGHAHADTLSVELSIDKQRVLVNSGTSTYDVGPERLRQRGTSAHNTLSINGENSSEVWSSFRVGRRASITEKRSIESGQQFACYASHNGYSRNFVEALHKRSVFFSHNSAKIRDEIPSDAIAKIYFHLHPETVPTMLDAKSGKILLNGGRVVHWELNGAAQINLVDTTWHPNFGTSLNNRCIEAVIDGNNSEFKLTW